MIEVGRNGWMHKLLLDINRIIPKRSRRRNITVKCVIMFGIIRFLFPLCYGINHDVTIIGVYGRTNN